MTAGEHGPFYGIARCHPRDRFNPETGRRVALAHLLQDADVPRERRKQVWADYWARFPRVVRVQFPRGTYVQSLHFLTGPDGTAVLSGLPPGSPVQVVTQVR